MAVYSTTLSPDGPSLRLLFVCAWVEKDGYLSDMLLTDPNHFIMRSLVSDLMEIGGLEPAVIY